MIVPEWKSIGETTGRARVLVGTMHSIENQFEECLDAVRRQRGVEVEHFMVEGLGNREAHAKLYSSFMERADEFDVFVKVDADMVILRDDLLARIAERFAREPDLDLVTIPVHDFFTDSLISGLHGFRSSVRWPERTDRVFVDDDAVPMDRRVVAMDLAPAARHCANPSPFQSFHFGLHRGVKLRSGLRQGLARAAWNQGHWEAIGALWKHFRRTQDPQVGWAALGSELALRGDFGPEHIPYTNPEARILFENRYAGWSAARLRRVLGGLRLRNRLALPSLWPLEARRILRRLRWIGIGRRRSL